MYEGTCGDLECPCGVYSKDDIDAFRLGAFLFKDSKRKDRRERVGRFKLRKPWRFK